MKKFTYWLAIFIASLIISLNPIQAARQIPGTAPELPPLQSMPQDVQPNYSGGFGTDSLDNPETNIENTTEDDSDENLPSENEEVVSPEIIPPSPDGSQLWIWVVAVMIAAAIAGTWYWFRSRKLNKS